MSDLPLPAAWTERAARERTAVRTLGAAIGFGNVMQLAAEEWEAWAKDKGNPAGAAHTVGPCLALTVPCGCTRGCDWCEGAGRLTKRAKRAKEEALHRKKKPLTMTWLDLVAAAQRVLADQGIGPDWRRSMMVSAVLDQVERYVEQDGGRLTPRAQGRDALQVQQEGETDR